MLQAVMFRLANYQVTVYGGNQESEGATRNNVNTRHLLPESQYLAIECNRAGIELFERFLADNPSLARVVHTFKEDARSLEAFIEMEALLQRSGVQFMPLHLSPMQTAELSREHFVVTVGVEEDGVSIIYRSAYTSIAAGGTYAAGTTQGLVWASLVQEIIQANQNLCVER